MSHTIAYTALQILESHGLDASALLTRWKPNHPNLTYLEEDTQIRWTFMIRRRSRLFLLAKPDYAPHYTEVYSVSTK